MIPKQITYILYCFLISISGKAQVLFSEKFNSLISLNTQTFSTTNGIIEYYYSGFGNGITIINPLNQQGKKIRVGWFINLIKLRTHLRCQALGLIPHQVLIIG